MLASAAYLYFTDKMPPTLEGRATDFVLSNVFYSVIGVVALVIGLSLISKPKH
jgi:hypothetical protein